MPGSLRVALFGLGLFSSVIARAEDCQHVREMVAWCNDTEAACSGDPTLGSGEGAQQCQTVKTRCPSFRQSVAKCGGGAGGTGAGAGADANAGLGESVQQTVELGQQLSQDAVEDLDRAAEALGRLRYESAIRRVDPRQRLGHSEESLEDLVDEEPAPEPPPVAYPRRQNAVAPVASRIVLEAARAVEDASCPAGTWLVTFSCRLKSPVRAGGCRSLREAGSGAACLGSTMCCLAPRERHVVLAASRSCPIRRCPSVSASPAQAALECPDTDGASCALVETPYPSLAHCATTAAADPPPGAPGGVWSGPACRSYLRSVDAWAKRAGALHEQDRSERQHAEAQGVTLPCPHGCDHAAGFRKLEQAFGQLRRGVQARLQEGRLGSCEAPLRQAETSSASLAFDTGYRAQALGDWVPPDDERGPYGTWSTPALDHEIGAAATRATLCAALEAVERCSK